MQHAVVLKDGSTAPTTPTNVSKQYHEGISMATTRRTLHGLRGGRPSGGANLGPQEAGGQRRALPRRGAVAMAREWVRVAQRLVAACPWMKRVTFQPSRDPSTGSLAPAFCRRRRWHPVHVLEDLCWAETCSGACSGAQWRGQLGLHGISQVRLIHPPPMAHRAAFIEQNRQAHVCIIRGRAGRTCTRIDTSPPDQGLLG